MNEESQKKLYIWILVALAVIGLLFILWAMFLNRGTLTVTAKTPFLMNIQGVRTESCSESPCQIVLAPGDYTVSLQKNGYRTIELNVSVPINGDHKEDATFQFIPVISKLGTEEEVNAFPQQTIDLGDEMKDTPRFFENNYVTYLAFDPDTKRQTLFVRTLGEGGSSEPTVATSFIRTMKDYNIIPGIEDHNSIAIIDRTDEGSNIYIVNLSEKTRENVLGFPYIADAKWMKGSDDLLLEAREEGETVSSIYRYKEADKTTLKLDLKTSVDTIAPTSPDHLIAATRQNFSGAGPAENLEGQLITLGERAATPSAGTLTTRPQTAFVDYSIPTNQARLITVDSTLPAIQKIKYNNDEKSITFLADGEVYKLQYAE